MKTKLEIGSGDRPYSLDPEWDRLDVVKSEHTTIVGDAREVPRPEGTYEEVYAHWVLEHFHSTEILKVLKEWYRVLKPGGKLIVITSNAEAINQGVVRGEITPEEWNYLTFAHNTWADIHKVGFYPDKLKHCFENAGFDCDMKVQTAVREEGQLSCPAIIIEATKR